MSSQEVVAELSGESGKSAPSARREHAKTQDTATASVGPTGKGGSAASGRASPSAASGGVAKFTVPSNTSQRSLISRVAKAECIETFVKNRPIVLYPLTADTLSQVPEIILTNLGGMDKSTYPQDYLEHCLGGAIVLQVSDGEPDFYPIGRKDYEVYGIISISEVCTTNRGLWEDLTAILDVDLGAFPHLQAGRKANEVHMVKLSTIGFDIEEEAQLEAPWGGFQTKPAQQDAYLALAYNEGKVKEVYMVNSDHQGNPIAYLPAEVVTSAVASPMGSEHESPGSQKARVTPV